MVERNGGQRRRKRAAALRAMAGAILQRLTVAVVAAMAAALSFAYLASEVAEGETRLLDTAVVYYFQQHQTPYFHTLMAAISWLASSPAVAMVVFLSVLGFWRAGRFWPDSVTMLIASIGGAGLIYFLKAFFHRARPAEIFAHLGYSFPSVHSFFALTIYGALAYLLGRDAPPRQRLMLWTAEVALILLVGFSRVFLGVHYPSDVAAGFLIALPWLWGCLALPAWFDRRRSAGDAVGRSGRAGSRSGVVIRRLSRRSG
jgi:membrane-associated phospholipid phosphatase